MHLEQFFVVVAITDKLKFSYLGPCNNDVSALGVRGLQWATVHYLDKSTKMEQSKIKISSKLLYLSPLSNKNGLDTDKIDDEKFEFSWIFNTQLSKFSFVLKWH